MTLKSLLLAGAGLALTASPAFAQTDPPQEDGTVATADEIIVTPSIPTSASRKPPTAS